MLSVAVLLAVEMMSLTQTSAQKSAWSEHVQPTPAASKQVGRKSVASIRHETWFEPASRPATKTASDLSALSRASALSALSALSRVSALSALSVLSRVSVLSALSALSRASALSALSVLSRASALTVTRTMSDLSELAQQTPMRTKTAKINQSF